MTDEQVEAELRRALRDSRVHYDAAGADVMIANATDAPLRPERAAWAAPLAAAAAVVVVGGGTALLATRGGGGSSGIAPAGGGGGVGCGTNSSAAPSSEPPPAPSSSVPTSGSATPTIRSTSAPLPTRTYPGDASGSHSRPGSNGDTGSVGRVPPGRPSFTPTSTRPSTRVVSVPLPSPTVSRRPVRTAPTPRPVPTCASTDGQATVPPATVTVPLAPSRAPRSTQTTYIVVRVPTSPRSTPGVRDCLVLNARTGRVIKRVSCTAGSGSAIVVPRSSAPRR